MAKVLEIRREPAICSIPVRQAVIARTATQSLTPDPIVAVFVVVKRF